MPTDLRADHAPSPLHCGREPRLSWLPGSAQSAYEIRAARSAAALALALATGASDHWQSGCVVSTACSDIAWGGAPLADAEQVWWTVRLRDASGAWTPWADAATLECGLTDWSATRWFGFNGGWPGRVLLMRGGCTLASAPARARLYVASPGGCTVRVNGTQLDTSILDPGKTVFAKRVAYRVLDCTAQLTSGDNALGLVLGTGWFGTPLLRCVLRVWFADGTTFTTGTAGGLSWMVGVGAVEHASPYDGEDVDLRHHQPGWDRPGYNCHGAAVERTRKWFWAHAVDGPSGALQPQQHEAETVVADEALREVARLPDGQRVYDVGRNLSGWVRVRGAIPTGETLSLRFAEIRSSDGSINQAPLYGARAEDRLTGDGKPCDWEPAFTYHGFRYVQARGPVDDLELTTREVRNAVARRSDLSCDHDVLGRLHTAMLRTEAANQHAVLTDCPQRSERMGWLNDLTARAPQAFICWDISRMATKLCDDYRDAQDSDGAIPDTVPYRIGHRLADPVCIAPIFLPLLQHRHFGRTSEIVRHLPTMRQWAACLLAQADAEGILHISHWGDWSPPSGDATKLASPVNPACPGPFVSTAFLAFDCRMMAQACTLAGESAEAARWQSEHQRIATAFRTKFVAADGTVGTGSQSCLAVALGLGVLSAAQITGAVAALALEVRTRGHLTTGNIASRFLLEVLSDHGHHDLALMLVTRSAYPSWGYMLDQGATTLWERWEGGAGGDMNSHSHPMLGSYQSWLYERLAGLRVADDACAADRFTIRPGPGPGVTRCAAHLDTPRGRAAVAWRHEGARFVLDVTLPSGSSADVVLPDGSRHAASAGIASFTCPVATTTAIPTIARAKRD